MKKYLLIPTKFQYCLFLLPYSHYWILLCCSFNFLNNFSIGVISIKNYVHILLLWFVTNSCLQIIVPEFFGINAMYLYFPLSFNRLTELFYVYITSGGIGLLVINMQDRFYKKYFNTYPEMINKFFTLTDIAKIRRNVINGIPWLGGFIICTFLGLRFQSEIILTILALILIIGASWPWSRMIGGMYLYLDCFFTFSFKRGILIMIGVMYLIAGFLIYILNHP